MLSSLLVPSLNNVAENSDLSTLAPQVHLAHLLHPSSKVDQLSESELLALVGRISSEFTLESLADGSLGARRYIRLFRTPAVEAWLIGWASSTYLGLHDHGGSNAAYQIVSGHLREASTELATGSELSIINLGAGRQRSLGPTQVHELWNPSEALAVSVHVYSPPLHTMSFYSDEPTTYLEKVRTETEAEWPDPECWAERAVG
jgi:hypothetical protein